MNLSDPNEYISHADSKENRIPRGEELFIRVKRLKLDDIKQIKNSFRGSQHSCQPRENITVSREVIEQVKNAPILASKKKPMKKSRRKRKSNAVVKFLNINVGDLVWAKMKGYQPWPASVERINGAQINVNFFGDDSSGVVFRSQITEFREGCEKNKQLMQKRHDIFSAAHDAFVEYENRISRVNLHK